MKEIGPRGVCQPTIWQSFFPTRKHSIRMPTDRTVTRDRVANKDEQ